MRQYIPQLRRSLSLKKISESYCFKPDVQKNDAHFQSLFIECFSKMRGVETLVKEASHSLVKKFEWYPDVCKRSETVIDEGDYDDTVMVSRLVTPELREELFTILKKTRGLQKELLILLQKEGEKLHPNLRTDDLDCFLRSSIGELRKSHLFSLYPTALVFSVVIPKCSDVFKDLLSQLLQIAWLENDLHQIKLYTEKPSLK